MIRLFTRRIKGRKGFIQRCTGFEIHKGKGKTIKIRRTFWAAEATEEETVASLRRVVNQARVTAKFRPKHFMAVEPIAESVRVPIWSLAYWTGNTKHVNLKIRRWVERKKK